MVGFQYLKLKALWKSRILQNNRQLLSIWNKSNPFWFGWVGTLIFIYAIAISVWHQECFKFIFLFLQATKTMLFVKNLFIFMLNKHTGNFVSLSACWLLISKQKVRVELLGLSFLHKEEIIILSKTTSSWKIIHASSLPSFP